MNRHGTIDSDMMSEHKAIKNRPAQELGFYLVASNRELLNHVEKLMNRQGVFGVLDSSGRVHYLVDARRGSPLAARHVMATAGRLAVSNRDRIRDEKRKIRVVVDRVLSRYGWNRQLRGYRLLGEILRCTSTDVSLLNPISKRLYPLIAGQQGLKPHQVERNVRYLFDDLVARELASGQASELLMQEGERSLPVGRTIARLAEEVKREMESFEPDDLEDPD